MVFVLRHRGDSTAVKTEQACSIGNCRLELARLNASEFINAWQRSKRFMA